MMSKKNNRKENIQIRMAELGHKFYDERKEDLILELVNTVQSQKEKMEDLAERLLRANEKLKDLDKLRSEFISIAVHQLKTPITAIRWTSELLYKNLTFEQTAKLKQILKANDQILALVNDMLDISRFEGRKIAGVEKIIDLKEFINEILSGYKVIYEEKNQKMEINIDSIVNKFKVKINFLNKILDNLISNAIKYTPKNGRIKISAVKKENAILITIADSGIGIPKNEQRNIFQKFFRASNAHKFSEGTGLGLSLAKSLTEEINGEINFVSKEGKGTIFTIKLPNK